MSNEDYWAGTVSIAGSLQAMDERYQATKARADLAEKRLRFIREICTTASRKGSHVSIWRITEILDGAADHEKECPVPLVVNHRVKVNGEEA